MDINGLDGILKNIFASFVLNVLIALSLFFISSVYYVLRGIYKRIKGQITTKEILYEIGYIDKYVIYAIACSIRFIFETSVLYKAYNRPVLPRLSVGYLYIEALRGVIDLIILLFLARYEKNDSRRNTKEYLAYGLKLLHIIQLIYMFSPSSGIMDPYNTLNFDVFRNIVTL